MSAESDKLHIPTLAIIGVGMIGGSLALALKKAGCVGKIIGAGRASPPLDKGRNVELRDTPQKTPQPPLSRGSLNRALALGVIDEIADDHLAAVAAADVILLAPPVRAMRDILRAIAPAVTRDKVLTDAGSVKGGIIDAAAELGALQRRFVPGHPVAGKEHSGVDAASADLFRNHKVVLTPTAETDADAVATVRQMWEATGAQVCEMDAALHDRILARTSHLPHVLAYTMVELFAGGDAEELAHSFEMAAGGFYDFTRTASSEPVMWRDICLMNREEILREVDRFIAALQEMRGRVEAGDGAALQRAFAAAKEVRGRVSERRGR